MKIAILAASAVIALAGMAAASAQTYSNTIHQSAGDRDSRGTPKYYQRYSNSPRRMHRSYRSERYMGATTGAGPSGPFYDNSIHQSAGGRDSRGTPKYYHAR